MPPEHANGRGPDNDFSDGEKLYRRFSPASLDSDGTLIAMQLVEPDFPRGLSTNRSKYSIPEDVLHPDCCAQKDYSRWGIAALEYQSLLELFEISGDGNAPSRRYRILVLHIPLEKCYAHTEITCCAEGENTPSDTGKVRRGFRAQLARLFSIERFPMR
jgi:hypothetical protein